ncbi:MAG: 16S rRNA (guanine(527)-N(7))-methyltransferase RsmG [Bacteroidia bacterium]|nr:16S rRNA (guanine(527)-N(7))-methyltransferase RsmG [Bacteroidia bacterium]
MVDHSIIENYFKDFTDKQLEQFAFMFELYETENAKVNVISRKDMDNFYIHHVLHSLALVKFGDFSDAQTVVDIGTGGGFPGIPLAIVFPEIEFFLVDSIGKKIRVVQSIANDLGLTNVTARNSRVESLPNKFDMAVARAVAPSIELYRWMSKNWKRQPHFSLLKGGDLGDELNDLIQENSRLEVKVESIASFYSEPFFETKKVVNVGH